MYKSINDLIESITPEGCAHTILIMDRGNKTYNEIYVDNISTKIAYTLSQHKDIPFETALAVVAGAGDICNVIATRSSLDTDTELNWYMSAKSKLISEGYVPMGETVEHVPVVGIDCVSADANWNRLYDDFKASTSLGLADADLGNEDYEHLPQLFIECFGIMYSLGMNADLYDHMLRYIEQEIDTNL